MITILDFRIVVSLYVGLLGFLEHISRAEFDTQPAAFAAHRDNVHLSMRGNYLIDIQRLTRKDFHNKFLPVLKAQTARTHNVRGSHRADWAVRIFNCRAKLLIYRSFLDHLMVQKITIALIIYGEIVCVNFVGG